MNEVKREGTKRLSLVTTDDAEDVTITLRHMWGDVLLEAEDAESSSGTQHYYDLTSNDTASSGEIKATWSYTMNDTAQTKTEWFKVFVPYTTSDSLFEAYPETEDYDEQFNRTERLIRGVIDTYCGQTFDFYQGLTYRLDGTNKNVLHLPIRVDALTSVTQSGGDEITTFVEIDPESKFYIRKKSDIYPGRSEEFVRWFSEYDSHHFFRSKYTYDIVGDFGWPFVPANIEEAANILIADYFNQDSDHRRHNITFTGVGPIQTRFNPDMMGTTGNIDADVLLMDYTRFVLDHI